MARHLRSFTAHRFVRVTNIDFSTFWKYPNFFWSLNVIIELWTNVIGGKQLSYQISKKMHSQSHTTPHVNRRSCHILFAQGVLHMSSLLGTCKPSNYKLGLQRPTARDFFFEFLNFVFPHCPPYQLSPQITLSCVEILDQHVHFYDHGEPTISYR